MNYANYITVQSYNLLNFLTDQHLLVYFHGLRQINIKGKSTLYFIFKDFQDVRDAINQYFILFGDDTRDHDDYWKYYSEERYNNRKNLPLTTTKDIKVVERCIQEGEGLIFDFIGAESSRYSKKYIFLKSEKLSKIKAEEGNKRFLELEKFGFELKN